jgi:nitrate reductase NapAB chaperone NapD
LAASGLHISSLVVRCLPESLHSVMAEVAALEGVEIHGSDPGGKFVALLDMESEQALVGTISAIETTRGVINASMVYHHVE